jgi:hypothetical protein
MLLKRVMIKTKGVYRERINPPHGGESDHKRIVYQAANGEKVEINVRPTCFIPVPQA